MKIIDIKKILLLILILAMTFSAQIYTAKVGQEKFMENPIEHELDIYLNVIPIDIWYVFLSLGILVFGVFLSCIVLGCFKGGGSIEEC